MSHTYKIATVFGGTGFVGRQVVRELAKRGITVKVATRVPERAFFLRPCGVVGQVVPFACNYNDPASIAAAVKNSDFVVNCIGILFEKGKSRRFKKIHAELPGVIATAAREAGVQKLVHISALGCDKGISRYAHTKLEGERAVLTSFPEATILRPGVIFGEGDNFFNMFARMARLFPFLPLIGGGHTKFQPVYVGDVADAVMAAILCPDALGKIYELGGPDVVDFREIYETMFSYTQTPRALIAVPFWWMRFKAVFLNLMPTPMLTPDQVDSLKTDNVISSGAKGLQDLRVNPTAMSVILPTYLESYRPGGRFPDKKPDQTYA